MRSIVNNLYGAIQHANAHRQDKVAILPTTGSVWSFADIDRVSSRLAAYFRQVKALSPGSRVSALVEKSPTAFAVYLACLRSGLVFHPLNPSYTRSELDYLLGDAEPSLIVTDPSRFNEMQEISAVLDISSPETLSSDEQGTLIRNSRECRRDFAIEPCESDATAVLLYSSGTTGRPKGIVLSHGNLLSGANALKDAWAITDDDCLMHALPIFHVHGLFISMSPILLAGASTRWLAAFEPATYCRYLPETTLTMGVPTHYTRLLAHEDFTSATCDNLRVAITGSAPMSEATHKDYADKIGQTLLERYGMTEAGVICSNPLNGVRKPGSVGLPLEGMELRVLSADGSPARVDEVGDIQIRGESVFSEYWRNPDKTAADFTDDGFFRTGDQGYLDKDGYLFIAGRSKDMIISGGLNVYSREIERELDQLPGITESAVIGVPHADFGEAVVAVLESKEPALDTAAIEAHLREVLAGYKRPKRLLVTEALPRNAMGKVLKNQLRETYKDLLS